MSPSPRAYLTYFDQHYLVRAVVMLRSLRQHDPAAEVFALCFDRVSLDVMEGLGDGAIHAVSAEALANFEPRLVDCARRSRWAFYATHKPILALYVFSGRPDLVSITFVDADTRFFTSPAPLFDEIGEASIAVSPHRFSPPYEALRKYGLYNAGFIYWRNDEFAHRCLTDYRIECLDWCENEVAPDGRFMNQGYLTAWPERYRNVYVIQHPGVNLAWWNLRHHAVASADGVTVDGKPLILFHYSKITLDEIGLWRGPRDFGDNLRPALQAIFRPYFEEIEQTKRWLRCRGIHSQILKLSVKGHKPLSRGPWPRSPGGFLKRFWWCLDPATRAERAILR